MVQPLGFDVRVSKYVDNEPFCEAIWCQCWDRRPASLLGWDEMVFTIQIFEKVLDALVLGGLTAKYFCKVSAGQKE
jgi:hypothetical protein